MAEAVKAKKLQPGSTIPGCNSFFLCKYLKDTMLQARTYLFCAIRPEVEFLKYTFATLGFAKNASVVRLAPKKATVAASAGERKLLAELDAMKALVAQLQAQSGGNSDAAKMIADLQSKLAEKQQDLTNEMGDDGRGGKIDEQAEQQRAEYAKRGISLAAYDSEGNTAPFFTNLDEDAFRSNRFMYIINKEWTTFGNKGDIQLMSLTVLRDHCKVKFDGSAVSIVAGKGDTWHNGKLVPEGRETPVAVYDRLALGDQLMLFRWPGREPEGVEPMSAEEAVNEFQEGLVRNRAGGDSGERQRISEEREKWEKEKAATEGPQRNEQEYQNAMKAVDNAILDLLPKTKEAKTIVDLFNRVTMSFDVVLEKGQDHIPRVKVRLVSLPPSSPLYPALFSPLHSPLSSPVGPPISHATILPPPLPRLLPSSPGVRGQQQPQAEHPARPPGVPAQAQPAQGRDGPHALGHRRQPRVHAPRAPRPRVSAHGQRLPPRHRHALARVPHLQPAHGRRGGRAGHQKRRSAVQQHWPARGALAAPGRTQRGRPGQGAGRRGGRRIAAGQVVVLRGVDCASLGPARVHGDELRQLHVLWRDVRHGRFVSCPSLPPRSTHSTHTTRANEPMSPPHFFPPTPRCWQQPSSRPPTAPSTSTRRSTTCRT